MNNEKPIENIPENIEPKKESKAILDYDALTQQNWLFIKAFIQTQSVKQAYELAGYNGESHGAPYALFKRLQPYVLDVLATGVNEARVQAMFQQLADIPLKQEEVEKGISVRDKIKLAEAMSKHLAKKEETAKPQISVLVINRSSGAKWDTGNNTPPPNTSEIIDIKPQS